MTSKFNIRVYGIVIDSQHSVLLSKEQYRDLVFVKFPGGGMKYGEGTIDTLRREFVEELGVQPIAFEHFYTTDFFQKSILDDSQIMSIYYLVQLPEEAIIPDFSDTGTLFFHPINEDAVAMISLPIDKVVASKLLAMVKKSKY